MAFSERTNSPEVTREAERHPRDVTCIFLLQHKDRYSLATQIQAMREAGTSLADIGKALDFSQVILMQKGQASVENPGQVMPVGGNIDPTDKTHEAAAIREMHEETHMRPSAIQDIGTFSYTHNSQKNGTQKV